MHQSQETQKDPEGSLKYSLTKLSNNNLPSDVGDIYYCFV